VADEQFPAIVLGHRSPMAAHEVRLALQVYRSRSNLGVQGLDIVAPVDVPAPHPELQQLAVVLDGLRLQLGCK